MVLTLDAERSDRTGRPRCHRRSRSARGHSNASRETPPHSRRCRIVVRVRPTTPPGPVQRERVDDRPAARLKMNIVEATQHRLAVRAHRSGVDAPRHSGHRGFRPGSGPGLLRCAPVRPSRFARDLQPPAEIPGVDPCRPIPRNLYRPAEPSLHFVNPPGFAGLSWVRVGVGWLIVDQGGRSRCSVTGFGSDGFLGWYRSGSRRVWLGLGRCWRSLMSRWPRATWTTASRLVG